MLCVGSAGRPGTKGETSRERPEYVLSTTAALNWNGLCREIVSSPSREVCESWLEISLGAHGERTPERVGLDGLQGPF